MDAVGEVRREVDKGHLDYVAEHVSGRITDLFEKKQLPSGVRAIEVDCGGLSEQERKYIIRQIQTRVKVIEVRPKNSNAPSKGDDTLDLDLSTYNIGGRV